MKKENALKFTLIILFILLISLISFAGIYVKDKNRMSNILPEYILGMDLKGGRNIIIKPNTQTEEKVYDKDGNLVTDTEKKDEEENVRKEVPINDPSILNTDNYEKTKEVIEKRVALMNVYDYKIRFNPNNGDIYLQVPEDNITDMVTQYSVSKGVLQILDSQTNEVLMDNQDIKDARVGYNNTATGTSVYLTIEFTKEGTKKLQDISKQYVESKDAEGNDTSKKIVMKLDDTSILETSFSEEITNGMLQLSMGTGTTNASIQQNLQQASNISILLRSGAVPVQYMIDENRFVFSDITDQDMLICIMVSAVIYGILLIWMMIKYKAHGLLGAISCIGYIAILLVVLRYTNVTLTMEGVAAIGISGILDYILLMVLLKNKDKDHDIKVKRTKENLSKFSMIAVPALITAVVFSFSKWMPIFSFGMTLFWGIVILVLYNLLITKVFIVDYETK